MSSSKLLVSSLRSIVRPSARSFASASSIRSSPPSSSPAAPTNTVSASEIALFSSLSEHWWNPTGEFALLHRMNSSRVKFVRESLLRGEELDGGGRWLKGKSVLDVGCGGGIFSEALARLGAQTMAIDAASANIAVAQTHASLDPAFPIQLFPASASVAAKSAAASSSSSAASPSEAREIHDLQYRHCAAEDLVKEGKQFDVVCAMEVIEHVEDATGFLDCLSDLTKPGGLLLLSTINRTPLAHLLDITMVEQVLRIVTPGTHTYSKFIKPSELQEYFDSKGWTAMERRGCIYDPIKGDWRLLGMGEFGGLGELANYFAGVRKPL